jgi:hypothetical protein
MIESLLGEPYTMLTTPSLLWVAPVVFEQERSDPLPRLSEIEGRRLACANQIADSFVNFVWDPMNSSSPARQRQFGTISSGSEASVSCRIWRALEGIISEQGGHRAEREPS